MKVLGLIVSIVVLSHSAFSQTGSWNGGPRTFSYQGEMRDKNGTLIADGVHSVLIELWDSSPSGGPAVYMEQQMVTFHNGIFDIIVGSAYSSGSNHGELPEVLKFNKPYWIQITFEPGGANEQKFPREPIRCAPYALNSERVNGIEVSAAPVAGNIFPLPMVNGKIDPAFLPTQPNPIQTINTVAPSGNGAVNLVGVSGITVTNDANTNTITLTGSAGQQPGTGATTIATGTTAQRPSTPAEGMIRFNTTTGKFEGYDGANWVNLN
jgi:hypothetical protein